MSDTRKRDPQPAFGGTLLLIGGELVAQREHQETATLTPVAGTATRCYAFAQAGVQAAPQSGGCWSDENGTEIRRGASGRTAGVRKCVRRGPGRRSDACVGDFVDALRLDHRDRRLHESGQFVQCHLWSHQPATSGAFAGDDVIIDVAAGTYFENDSLSVSSLSSLTIAGAGALARPSSTAGA